MVKRIKINKYIYSALCISSLHIGSAKLIFAETACKNNANLSIFSSEAKDKILEQKNLINDDLIDYMDEKPETHLEKVKLYSSCFPTKIFNGTYTEDNSKTKLARRINSVLLFYTFRGKINFSAQNLDGLDLTKIELMGVNFQNASLVETKLRSACLCNTNFSYTDLRKTDLFKAELSRADLSYANLDGADLRGARLNDTNFSHAIITENTLFDPEVKEIILRGENRMDEKPETHLRKIRLYSNATNEINILKRSGKHIGNPLSQIGDLNISFIKYYKTYNYNEGLKLSTLDSRQNLDGLNLEGIILSGGNLQGASLVYTNFERSILYKANFSHSNLTGAKFGSADLWDADLSYANLDGADFRYATLGNTNFSHAKITERTLFNIEDKKHILNKYTVEII